MDHGANQKREINPKETAGFLSTITFFFTYTIFKNGIQKELQDGDIYEIPQDYRAKMLGDKLEAEWEKEKIRHKNPSIIRLMLKCYGPTYLSYGCLQLIIKTVFITVSPMCMGKLVSYFTPDRISLSKADAWFYAVALLGIHLFQCIGLHSYRLLIMQLNLRIRAAFCSLLYRKTLKLTATSLGQVTIGKIVTIISKDVMSFYLAIMLANDLWIGMIHIVIIGYLMFSQIGISAVIGIAFIILLMPLQFHLAKRISVYRIKSAEKTDERLRTIQETLTSIKIIKMYAWETFFSRLINSFRKSEISILRKNCYVKSISLSVCALTSRISFFICVICYIYFQKHITAEKAFTVLSYYYTMEATLTMYIPLGIAQFAELRSSLQRIGHVLMSAETSLERSSAKNTIQNSLDVPHISMNEATVKMDGMSVLDKVTVELRSGLTAVTGNMGSGKSVFLSLILNEITAAEGSVNVEGTISYASQEPWLFPGSIKQNILFGQPFDKHRFDAVLHACCLNSDLEILPHGENSIVGDRGLNLSKGQQTRINLARAVYKDCNIYLFDDCLSALDAYVSMHVFNVCIKDLLKDKVCVLVTNQIQYLPLADNILILNQGTVENTGSYKKLEQECTNLNICRANESATAVQTGSGMVANESYSTGETSKLLVSQDNRVYGESKQEGKVDIKVYRRYFTSGGGPLIMFGLAGIFIATQIATSYADILVGKWVDVEQSITDYNLNNLTNTTPYEDVKRRHDITVTLYSAMLGVATVFTLTRAFCYFLFSCRASVMLHKMTLGKILEASMEFFDTHLIANIFNRLSRDLAVIDEYIPYITFEGLRILLILVGILYVICTASVLFLLPTCFIVVVLYFVCRYYLLTSRSLKRLEGATRSPIVGHLNASLEGLVTIRANKVQQTLQDEFDGYLDVQNSVYYMYMSATYAVSFFMDFLCVIYISIITLTFINIDTGALAGKVGLVLTQTLLLTSLLQWCILQWTEVENEMTSVERILEYTNAEAENVSGREPKNWPSQGRIAYKNVRLTYYNSSVPVLKNLSFVVEPCQKVGIVGRTGAGKSTIISALFRLYDVEGSIIIDNENIKDLAVHIVRSRISVIPQDPVLFTGTIRDNLDPHKKYSDHELWNAVECVKLKKVIPDLQFRVTGGGFNFSVGQKQLICLARAIIGSNKILVLDEATASVDPKTDALIQNIIKEQFSGCTVLTIAHRLNTVLNSDKVMVIDNGALIEYDTPERLLRNRKGTFYSMVNKGGTTL